MSLPPGQFVVLTNTFLSVIAEPSGCEQKRSRSTPPLARAEEPAAQGEVPTQQLAHLDAIMAGRVSPSFARSRCAATTGVGASVAGNAEATADDTHKLQELPMLMSGLRPVSSAEPAVGGEALQSTSEQLDVARKLPCKGKRERIKKALALIEGKILQDPDIFASGRFFLPPYVESDPEARARAMAHLAQVAADAYARLAAS